MTGIVALPAQLAEQLHAVHARHLDVEHGEIDRLRRQALQRLGAVAIAAHREALGLERHRHRGQDVAVVIDKSNRVRHGFVPQGPAPHRAGGRLAINMATRRQYERLVRIRQRYGLLARRTKRAEA